MSKFKDKSGYIKIIAKNHHRAFKGSVHEHVIVMENHLGRPLPNGTVVHHINKIRSDNRIENLLLLRCEDDHLSLHRAMKKNDINIIKAYESWGREFMKLLRLGLPEKECFQGSLLLVNSLDVKSSGKGQSNKRKSDLKSKLNFEELLFFELRRLRKLLAENHQVPAFIIFHDKTLVEMSKVMPSSKSDMLEIRGVGPAKFEKYGRDFIDMIKRFKEEYKLAS